MSSMQPQSPSSSCSHKEGEMTDIEDLHHQALLRGSTTYQDPKTGFTVFTELSHLRRGKCCGNVCRHCPYGFSNVKAEKNATPRPAKVQSGDMESVRLLLKRIQDEADQHTIADTNGVLQSRSNDEYPDDVGSNVESVPGKGGRHGGKLTLKNVPYTRGGDTGTSQLFTGERRSKTDDAFEAMGTVDELCTIVGTAHAELTHALSESSPSSIKYSYGELPEWLLDTMSRLFDIGSHVAKPAKIVMDDDDENDKEERFRADGVGGGFDEEHIQILEDWIDVMTEALPELDSFVLPTGGKASAQLHVARTVCRRAERRIVGLVRSGVCDPNAMRYINRLSDFFFTAARWTNFCEGREEIQYRRHERGAKQRNRVTVNLNHKDTP